MSPPPGNVMRVHGMSLRRFTQSLDYSGTPLKRGDTGGEVLNIASGPIGLRASARRVFAIVNHKPYRRVYPAFRPPCPCLLRDLCQPSSRNSRICINVRVVHYPSTTWHTR